MISRMQFWVWRIQDSRMAGVSPAKNGNMGNMGHQEKLKASSKNEDSNQLTKTIDLLII